MNIYYWCPFLSSVATVRAVINSVISIKKYSKNKISPHIINAVGEWNDIQEKLYQDNINFINFSSSESFYNSLPRFGYLKSRFSYILIFFRTIIQLHKFLKQRDKKDIFVIHLISSLPLILILIFNYKCKFILRISGLPKLNIFRKLLWKLTKDKLSGIFCPTKDTKNYLISKNIFNEKNYFVLEDPIINVKSFRNLKNQPIIDKLKNKKYIVNIGRLTNQKNQELLIKAFSEFRKNDKDLNLVIIGEGELMNKLKILSNKLGVYNYIYFEGYRDNVFNYLSNAEYFILTSKWEDPGFVIIEAAFCRVPILSSDCPNGPKEILENGRSGYLFKSNNLEDLKIQHKKIRYEKKKYLYQKKLNALKNVKKYTLFYHYNKLTKILDSIKKNYD
mgnify:CR=1 FL=1